MSYNRLNEIEAIGKALEKLAERMADDLGDLPYSRVSEYIDGTGDMASSLIFEVRQMRAEAAALEAPAQPLDELRSVTPATEEASGDQLLTAFEDDHIVARAPLIDAQTCEEVDPRVSWKADMVGATTGPWEPEIPEGFTKWQWRAGEEENPDIHPDAEIEVITKGGERKTLPAHTANWAPTVELYRMGLLDLDEGNVDDDVEFYRIISEPSEETLPGDEADERVATIEEVVGWNDAQNAGFEGSFDEYVEAAAEPASVLNDPELQAAVDRANASIAQDEPQPYVGCIDEELERDYDAAKARTTIKHEDAKKPFFAFLGAKPKTEEVC